MLPQPSPHVNKPIGATSSAFCHLAEVAKLDFFFFFFFLQTLVPST